MICPMGFPVDVSRGEESVVELPGLVATGGRRCSEQVAASGELENIGIPRCEPWCWNIYLQNWAMFRVNVGKYSSTMEHLGDIYIYIYLYIFICIYRDHRIGVF